MANVQISEELFLDLVRWHLLDYHDPNIEIQIRTGLQDKLDRMSNRVEYGRNLSQRQDNL